MNAIALAVNPMKGAMLMANRLLSWSNTIETVTILGIHHSIILPLECNFITHILIYLPTRSHQRVRVAMIAVASTDRQLYRRISKKQV